MLATTCSWWECWRSLPLAREETFRLWGEGISQTCAVSILAQDHWPGCIWNKTQLLVHNFIFQILLEVYYVLPCSVFIFVWVSCGHVDSNMIRMGSSRAQSLQGGRIHPTNFVGFSRREQLVAGKEDVDRAIVCSFLRGRSQFGFGLYFWIYYSTFYLQICLEW